LTIQAKKGLEKEQKNKRF